MKIRIEKLDINNEEQIHSLVKWDNDPEFSHLIQPVRKESDKLEVVSYEILKKRYSEDPKHASGIYIIFDESRPIGNFSMQIDPGHLMKKIKGTSWLGLTIGEKEYWGFLAP